MEFSWSIHKMFSDNDVFSLLLKIFGVKCLTCEGCLTVHLPHEIT